MLTYKLHERGTKSKTTFLCEKIKEDIVRGRLSAGEKLPSKRKLAEHLGISVITVENAYAILEEEGYLSARERSGFFVNALRLPEASRARAKKIRTLKEEPRPQKTEEIPGMARIMRKLLSERPEILQMQPPVLGCATLRNAIAEHLRSYRGMEVNPSHIVVGSGSEYLYALIAQLLSRRGVFGIEDPSYEKIEKVYRASGAKIAKLKMGEDGIRAASLERTKAKVLHVTPYHSYPSGVTATAEKRFAYLSWAASRGGYLIEDDFDSEFSFFRRPIETLFSMDRGHRVIYMNTFSKSIAPSIRVAYMILPDELLAEYKERLGFYSCTVPVFDQYVLAEFIRSGSFERQLNRLRSRWYNR